MEEYEIPFTLMPIIYGIKGKRLINKSSIVFYNFN